MKPSETYILYTRFNRKLERNQFEKFYFQLPSDLQKNLSQFRNWRDAQASVLGKMLLKRGLMRYFGFPEDILSYLELTSYNKPVLSHSKVDFSISHSGQFVICAITPNGRIGIDVERIRPVTLDHFIRQFSGQELVNIYRSKNKYQTFFSYWTKKEAVLKAEGKGHSIPLSQIAFSKSGEEAEVFHNNWYLNDIQVDHSYCSWLATDKPLKNGSVVQEFLPFEFFQAEELTQQEMEGEPVLLEETESLFLKEDIYSQ